MKPNEMDWNILNNRFAEIQRLCKELNAQVAELGKEIGKHGEIYTDDDERAARYFYDRANDVRSYLTYQADWMRIYMNRLEDNRRFYEWNKRK